MATLSDIRGQLEKPFDPQHIGFLPKSLYEDRKTKESMCVGYPYADKRVYEDRLDEICPGEWSDEIESMAVAGNVVIYAVRVTICGVSHSDTGQGFVSQKADDNGSCDGYAQAFKRACSKFGLGKYLYRLDKQYLPFNKEAKRIDKSPQELRDVVLTMYKKAGITIAPAVRSRTLQESTPVRSLPSKEATNEPVVQARQEAQEFQSVPDSRPEITKSRSQVQPVREQRPQPAPANEAKPAESTPQPEITKSHSQVRPQGTKPQQARPVYYEVFQAGKKQGLWQGINGFCEFASKELGLDVNSKNMATLAPPRMDQLMAAITGKDPIVAKQTVTADKQ